MSTGGMSLEVKKLLPEASRPKRGVAKMRVKDSSKAVSVLEVRKLLYDLRDNHVGVSVRFRRLGEMWKPNFMTIVDLNDRGAIFSDATTTDFVFVTDLVEIMQFELDNRFQAYEPFYHYEVTPWV